MSDYLPANCSDRDLDEHYTDGFLHCAACGDTDAVYALDEMQCPNCGADLCCACWEELEQCPICFTVLPKPEQETADDST